jgi:membrane dipeptidase
MFRWRDFFAWRIILCWFIVVPGVFTAFQDDLLAQDVIVSGRVTDKHTGLSVAAARIRLAVVDGERIDSVETDGQGEWLFTYPPTGVGRSEVVPEGVVLGQNYPNPFNPTTQIPFRVKNNSVVRLTVHNILGQLMDAREFAVMAGTYSVEWRGKGSAGVYFYSIEVDGARSTRKMVQMDGGSAGGIGGLTGYARPILSVARTMSTQSVWVTADAFGYEPDSVSVTLTGAPRADLAIESVHDRAFVIDLHNDVLEKIVGSQYAYDIGVRHAATTSHTDLPRMRDGGLDAQMLSVWISPSYDPAQYFTLAVQFLDSLSAQVMRNSSLIAFATSADSVTVLNADGEIAGVLLLEGGHCIAEDLEKLKYFYSRGVRCMTITWNNSTSWAVSAQDSRSATVGLSEFGRQVIRTMDSLGMIIDVSHVGIKTVEDILAIAAGPVIASHSGCAALCNHYRNLTDDQIRAIAATGGVIGVVFYPPFLSSSGVVTTETVANHIDHIRNLVGVDYIALGSDFDGIERTPVGLEDVSRFPELTKALLRRGYTKEDVRKILGGNFMRVLRSVCK